MTSSQIVRYLLNQNYFIPLTLGEWEVLKTLEYNEKYCTKRMAPYDVKEPKNPVVHTYWYADFECDASDIHTPYML